MSDKVMTLKEAATLTGLKQATLKDLNAADFFEETQTVGEKRMLLFSEPELNDKLSVCVETALAKEAAAAAESEDPGSTDEPEA